MEKESLEYDERTGTFVSRGSDMGTGKRQPVGSFNVKKESPIPDYCYSKPVERYEEKKED